MMVGELPSDSNGQAAMYLSAVVPAYIKKENVRRLLGALAEQKIARGALGEIVAARAGLMCPLPEDSAVDEASIEALLMQQSYKLQYVSEAVDVNRVPANVREFVRQRRRFAADHSWMRDTRAHALSNLDWKRILRLALCHFTQKTKPRLPVIRTNGAERG
jgi:hypothetical protein